MTKEAFLHALQHALARLPREKRKAVLADYEEFFASGLAEGASEETLCARFGTPQDIAAEVCEAQGERGVPAQTLALWLMVVIIAVAVLCFLPAEMHCLAKTAYGALVAAASFIFVLMRRFSGTNPESVSVKLCSIAVGVAVVLVAGVGVLVANFINSFLREIPPETMGPLMAAAVLFTLAVICGTWLLLLLRTPYLPRWFVLFHPLLGVLLTTLCAWFFMLTTLVNADDVAVLPGVWTAMLWQLPAFAAALFLLVRKERTWTHK